MPLGSRENVQLAQILLSPVYKRPTTHPTLQERCLRKNCFFFSSENSWKTSQNSLMVG